MEDLRTKMLRLIVIPEGVDRTLATMGLTVLKTRVRAPQANRSVSG